MSADVEQRKPLSDDTHLSASFYVDSHRRPFPQVNVVCRLEARTDSVRAAIHLTGVLFDVLCEMFDADLLGVSLPLHPAWTDGAGGLIALAGFELLPVVGVEPTTRMSEMIAGAAPALPADLTVTVPLACS